MRSRLKALVLAVVVVTAMAGVGATGAAGANGDSSTTTGESANDGATIASSFGATVESGHFEVGSGEQNDQDHFEFTECPGGEGEECIEISGNVDEDGSFSAAPGDVNFPPITVEDTSAGDIDVYITAPDGLQGQVQENGEMTLGGDLYVDLRELSEGCGIDVTLDATTGDSGDLSGSAIDVSEDGETGTATLVDNEFEVPSAEGCGVLGGAVDDELDLPSPSGENEMVMNTHFEFGYEDATPQTGTVQGTVTNANGDPVVGASVTLDGQEVATDDSGSFQAEATDGEHDLTVSAAGYADGQSTVDVAAGETTSADVALEPDGETDYRVAATPVSGASGDTGEVDVAIEPVSDDAGAVDSFELPLEFDPDVVSLNDVREGDWEGVEVDESGAGDGTVVLSGETGTFSFSGQETPFTVATAEFELAGDAGEQAAIGFGDDASVEADGGTLFGLLGSPTVAYDDAPASIDEEEEPEESPDDGGDVPDDGGDGDAGAPDDGEDGADGGDGGAGTPDDGDAPDETAPDDGEFDPDAWADWLEAQSAALEAEYYEKVPGEINAQSQERINTDIVEPVSSPADMRAEADKIEDDLGDVHDDADEAYGALRDAADFIEEFRPMFSEAAESLRNADDPESEAERINEDVIDYVNADIEESNERLENVEPIGTVDHIDTEGGGPDDTEGGAGDGDGGDDAGDPDEESTSTLASSLASVGAGVALISTLAGVVISLWSTLGTGLLARKP